VTDIIREVKNEYDFAVQLRRDLHRHPELGFKEKRTSQIIQQELTGLGFSVHDGIAVTGVSGLLDTGKPGPVILLRFDMDALPIYEENEVEYRSEFEGVMHACGHDGHVAIGLTTARVLQKHRSNLSGKIRFVFQPAEEGLGGAQRMVQEGILENPRADLALALHLWNEKPLGWLGITSGPVMAGAKIFKILITGKGGHGALPHETIDPVLAGSQIVTSLQSIVSRNVNPFQTAVVSVTSFTAGEAFNVIPKYATLKGTIRAFDPATMEKIVRRMQEIINGVASGMGCEANLEFEDIAPPVSNDAEVTEHVSSAVAADLPDLDIDRHFRTMVSEDMAYMLQKVKGCFIFIGSANAEKDLKYGHHHPKFDFDERALINGAAVLVSAVISLAGTK
jgi:amidohydrolase